MHPSNHKSVFFTVSDMIVILVDINTSEEKPYLPR